MFANIVGVGQQGHIIATPSRVINDNVFEHVALTYDKNTGLANLYVNGALVAQTNLGVFTPEASFDLYFGQRPAGPFAGAGTQFSGVLDEIEFFNRALSSSEIAAIFNAGSAGKCKVVPFDIFDIEEARVDLDQAANRDRYEVEGTFQAAVSGNGIDVLNEDVTVIFDGFSETIPAGSFFRDDDDEGFQFDGAPGGITRIDLKDDGEFEVKARDLDLSAIDLNNPVPFSLQIGHDLGETEILFDSNGRFRQ